MPIGNQHLPTIALSAINTASTSEAKCYFIVDPSIAYQTYNTKLTGFVARGPRASQCLTLSEDVESS